MKAKKAMALLIFLVVVLVSALPSGAQLPAAQPSISDGAAGIVAQGQHDWLEVKDSPLDSHAVYLPIVSQQQGKQNSASAWIGAQGGILLLEDGTRLEIPPGALATETLVTLAETQPPAPLPWGMTSSDGYVTNLEPDGLILGQPARLYIPLPPGADHEAGAIHTYDPESAEWWLVSSLVDSDMALAQISHFSSWEWLMCGAQSAADGLASFQVEGIYVEGDATNYLGGTPIPIDVNGPSTSLLFKVHDAHNAFGNCEAAACGGPGTRIDLEAWDNNQQIVLPPDYVPGTMAACQEGTLPSYYYRVCTSDFTIKWPLPASFMPGSDPISFPVKAGVVSVDDRPAVPWCYRLYDEVNLTLERRSAVCIPSLVSPEEGAIMDNGDFAGDALLWDFDWSDCEGATEYGLYVKQPDAAGPLIDLSGLSESAHRHQCGDCVIVDEERSGWTWRVRARVGGEWGNWSAVQTFDVEPSGSDAGNRPPFEPSSPSPANGTFGVPVGNSLAWSGGDPDADDVTYDVYLDPGSGMPQTLICNDVATPACDPGTLDYLAQYAWYVVATDEQGATSGGPLWTFTTQEAPGICTPFRQIACGETHAWGNNSGGTISHIPFYACSSRDESGPEVTYRFVPDRSGDVVASLSGMSADLDLFLLDDVDGLCHADSCIAYGDASISFEAVGDATYYLVVDGYQGAISNYSLTVWCSCDERPYVPSAPTPGDGATEIRVEADLSWSGGHPCTGEKVTYDVYLEAGDSTPDVLVCDDATNSGCDPGTLATNTHYYWRVVAQGTNGPVAGPVWEFWTEPAPCTLPPYTPWNPSPANGSTEINVDADLSWMGGHPCAAEAVTYDVYLAPGDSTPNILVCNDVTNPLCDPGPLAYGQDYYWQVVAQGRNGPTLGPVWTFRTEVTPCTDPPYVPSNPSPGDGASEINVDADLSWTGGHPCIGEPVTYDVYLEAGDSTPDILVCNDVPSPLCDPGTLAYDQDYYWRVVAQGTNGPTIGPVWAFRTGAAPCTDPPYTPSNPSPADGATEINVDADLSWTGGHPCEGEAVTYDVYLAAGDSTPDILVCNDVTSPVCDPGTLAYGQDYYWRVVASGANGPTVGPIWTFRTSLPPCSDPPNTPSDPSPADGATGVAGDANLSWSGGHPCIGQPVTYDVYLAAGGGTPTVLVCNDVTSPLCDPGPLAYEQLYTWQVVANGANGPAAGPIWSFTTGPEPCLDPPLTPSNPTPADGAESVAVNAGLSWSGGHPCEGETVTYDVYLEARDKTPDVLVCNDVTVPECRPGPLAYRTRYYWQVVANGANGPTLGPVWTFFTMPAPQASTTARK